MEKFEEFMSLIEISHDTKGDVWVYNRRVLRIHLRKLIALEIEASKLNEKKPIRYRCLLCGRDKFTRKTPHNCKDGFRRRRIKWQPIFE